jgi:hypothetical protein
MLACTYFLMTIKFCKTLLLDIEVTIRTGRDKNPFVSSLNFQTSIIDYGVRWGHTSPHLKRGKITWATSVVWHALIYF